MNQEVIEYIEEPIYHGNPIDENIFSNVRLAGYD